MKFKEFTNRSLEKTLQIQDRPGSNRMVFFWGFLTCLLFVAIFPRLFFTREAPQVVAVAPQTIADLPQETAQESSIVQSDKKQVWEDLLAVDEGFSEVEQLLEKKNPIGQEKSKVVGVSIPSFFEDSLDYLDFNQRDVLRQYAQLTPGEKLTRAVHGQYASAQQQVADWYNNNVGVTFDSLSDSFTLPQFSFFQPQEGLDRMLASHSDDELYFGNPASVGYGQSITGSSGGPLGWVEQYAQSGQVLSGLSQLGINP